MTVKPLKLVVVLNGTNVNPWNHYGLKHNPFPQLGIAEYDAAEMQVASLDGDPIEGADDIRRRLEGFSAEFIQLCVDRFIPGQRVRFAVTFPRRR